MGKYLEMCFFSHADVTSPFPTCFFFLPFQLNFNNIRRLGHAFFPPKSGILQQYFELGHKDASRFLVREGLYEITKPGDRKPLVYESSVWRSRLCEDDDGLLYEDDLLYDEVVGVKMMTVFCMRMVFFMTMTFWTKSPNLETESPQSTSRLHDYALLWLLYDDDLPDEITRSENRKPVVYESSVLWSSGWRQ